MQEQLNRKSWQFIENCHNDETWYDHYSMEHNLIHVCTIKCRGKNIVRCLWLNKAIRVTWLSKKKYIVTEDIPDSHFKYKCSSKN